MSLKVVVRAGSRVERHRFGDLREALGFLERRGRELEAAADAGPVKMPLARSFEPVQQVVARLSVAGSGGVDIRGDGSSEAWTGRFRRRLVEQREGESAYEALRRALS